MEVMCPVSIGELIDKLSILCIKEQMIQDDAKRGFVLAEKKRLEDLVSELSLGKIDNFLQDLNEVNLKLWKIEDDIREKERVKEFDSDFVELARSVYITNDRRFEIKRSINETYGSQFQEVKSYQKYD